MVVAGGYGAHPAQTADLHGYVAVGGGVVPQLALTVPPPRPSHPIALDRYRMGEPGSNSAHPAQAADLHGNVAVGRGVVAQLAVGVESPGPHRAIALEGY